jgi:hypothetical protein
MKKVAKEKADKKSGKAFFRQNRFHEWHTSAICEICFAQVVKKVLKLTAADLVVAVVGGTFLCIQRCAKLLLDVFHSI